MMIQKAPAGAREKRGYVYEPAEIAVNTCIGYIRLICHTE
jgi:hypothetical protein